MVFLVTVAAIAWYEVGAQETLFRQAGVGAWIYWLLYAASALALVFCLLRTRSALAGLQAGRGLAAGLGDPL
ncbi:MAG: hypothetical protein L3J03_10615 [Desulfobacterales bacterium]|nr:hypothetical protein [Desulfobacterales bacterium]